MFLHLVAGLLLIVAISISYFLWCNRDIIGTTKRQKFYAEIFKNFFPFHNSLTSSQKKMLFEPLHKLESSFPEMRKKKSIRILEIGAGAGSNLQFYPKASLTVVEPNPFAKKNLEENLEKFPQVELEKYVVAYAEDMKDIEDHSVDVVVSTLVQCSIPNLQKVYKEIRRVLVPGGKFFFMEHIIEDKLGKNWLIQRVMGVFGIFPFMVDGCRPDKDVEGEVNRGGFSKVELHKFRLELEGEKKTWDMYMLSPHLYGIATTAK